MRWQMGLSILAVWLTGAVAASAIVWAAMPAEAFRGLTLPQTSLGAAFAIEVVITLVLVTVILAEAANEFAIPMLDNTLSYLVIATTILSGGWYLVRWGQQMANVEEI